MRDREGEPRAFAERAQVLRLRGDGWVRIALHRSSVPVPRLDLWARRRPSRRARAEADPDFDREPLGLLPCAGGHLGRRPSSSIPTAARLCSSDTLGPLSEIVAQGGVDVDRARIPQPRAYSSKTNWKVAVQNYLDVIPLRRRASGLHRVHPLRRPTHIASSATRRSRATTPRCATGSAEGSVPSDLVLPRRSTSGPGPSQPLHRNASSSRDRAHRGLPRLLLRAGRSNPDWTEGLFELDSQVGAERSRACRRGPARHTLRRPRARSSDAAGSQVVDRRLPALGGQQASPRLN